MSLKKSAPRIWTPVSSGVGECAVRAAGALDLCFVIPSSFVIRASSFFRLLTSDLRFASSSLPHRLQISDDTVQTRNNFVQTGSGLAGRTFVRFPYRQSIF